jgi:hypothetical protein
MVSDTYFESSFQRSNIIVVRRSQLGTGFEQGFRPGGVFVASYAADCPAFFEHVAGDGAAEAAGCAADDDCFGHFVSVVFLSLVGWWSGMGG